MREIRLPGSVRGADVRPVPTATTPLPMRKHGAFLLAAPMLPWEATEAASRPGRTACGCSGRVSWLALNCAAYTLLRSKRATKDYSHQFHSR